MLPKSPQSSSKGVPRRVQRSIFKGFLMNLGNFFRYFWLWKLIISPKIPGIICTCWVTPSLEKYILTDFKPHVQLEFKFKNNSILHGADARSSKQQQAKAKTDFETPSVQKNITWYIIRTCWVTPSLEKCILTDFKPHVWGRPAVCA